MIEYIFIFICIFAGGFLYNSKVITKKVYVFSICILLILVAGLRHISMGLYDTELGYVVGWKNACNSSWNDILNQHINNTYSSLKDAGFAMFTKLISYLTSNVHVYIFVLVVPYMSSASWFIYKYSKNPTISFFLFLALNYFTSSYYLIRHTLATTFIILAIDSLLSNKKVKATILIFIAATFHKSAIVFIVLLVVSNKNLVKVNKILLISTLITGLIGKDLIIFISKLFVNNSRFEYYLTSGVTQGLGRWIMSVCILLLCLYSYKKLIKQNMNNVIFYNLSILTCCFYAFTPIIADFHRLAMFFGIGNIILLPNAIRSIENTKLRALLTLIIIFLFSAYIIELFPKVNAYPYKFYWE